MPPRFVYGNHMNILIVGPSWVGDMVMAQTLFQCLKQRHPQCEIDVLAPEWSRPILERMPEVRQALSFPLGHGALELATRRRIGKSLAGQYDQAILLPNSLKSALVPLLAAVPMSAPTAAYCAAVGSCTLASATLSPALALVSLASAKMAA